MSSFDRVLNPGRVSEWNGSRSNVPVFVRAQWDGKRLSLTGVVGPRTDGDCYGSCGQVDLLALEWASYAEGWSAESVAKLAALWDRWHLNDMRPMCDHQRERWGDLSKRVTVTRWRWGKAYHALLKRVTTGTDSEENVTTARELARLNRLFERIELHGYTTTGRHVWDEGTEEALAAGFIEQDSQEEKARGWVYPSEHPDGVLCKPCEVCGYKYGSQWLTEAVPASVLERLQAFPETTVTPAWV